MTNLLERRAWPEYLQQFDHLVVGFSGGLDSSLLLSQLAAIPSLKTKLVALHVNHGLNPKAGAWQQHCLDFCSLHQIECRIELVKISQSNNLEEAAREARYQCYARHTRPGDALILGHHQDDQAETLLLHLCRGAGVAGLSAMAERQNWQGRVICRPLLSLSRASLEHQAKALGLAWVEDDSNLNTHYSRNFLRHEVLPLLSSRWPAVSEALARTAQHCQEARSNLQALAEIDLPDLKKGQPLPIASLRTLPPGRAVNLLQYWLELNSLRLPSSQQLNVLFAELIHARGDAQPQLNWASWQLRRFLDALYLIPTDLPKPPQCLQWKNFPKPIDWAGAKVRLIAEGEIKWAPAALALIELRRRQGGERFFYKGHHRSLKKCFQDWQVPPWLRERLPLLFIDGELAAVPGYGLSDTYHSLVDWKIVWE